MDSATAQTTKSDTRLSSSMLDDLLSTEAGRREVDAEMHKRGYTKPQGIGGNLFHSVEHIFTPGIGNIIQGVVTAFGVFAAGKGAVTLGRWGWRKATGSDAGNALP